MNGFPVESQVPPRWCFAPEVEEAMGRDDYLPEREIGKLRAKPTGLRKSREPAQRLVRSLPEADGRRWVILQDVGHRAEKLRSAGGSEPESHLGPPGENRICLSQRRFYPFNVYSEKKRLEKLDYMHNNPVVRGRWPRPVSGCCKGFGGTEETDAAGKTERQRIAAEPVLRLESSRRHQRLHHVAALAHSTSRVLPTAGDHSDSFAGPLPAPALVELVGSGLG